LSSNLNQGYIHVPSYGWPASDNILFSENFSPVPMIPTGRLAAISGDEVKIYLEKIQAMEANFDNPQTIEDRAWMKKVLHLGGGSTVEEQVFLRGLLENMEMELTNNDFGADVQGFYKNSNDPIQNSGFDEIFDVINGGTSIMTFFGHSSPGTFDFNVDNPENYFNFEKYPLMLSLGCYSGNIFIDGRSSGERFTFYKDKISIAFAASRGVGFISSLSSLGRSFYSHIGGEFYGQSIGNVIRASLLDHSDESFIGTATLVEQFILHGDPAIRLNPSPGPDFVIDASSFKFEPEIITANRDSFSFQFDVFNLGKNTRDTVVLSLIRELPDGSIAIELRDTVAISKFRQAFSYSLPTEGRAGLGLNKISAVIDVDNVVDELPAPEAEMNNQLQTNLGEEGISFFIIDNTARPVYPAEFAIVGEPDIVLKAVTTDVLAPERRYLLEIDTTALFNSTFKNIEYLSQKGGVIKWSPEILWQDSTIYYWRISPDSISGGVGYIWEESSFTYLSGTKGGWKQGGYWQFKRNNNTNINFIDSLQRINFSTRLLDMRIRNKVWNANDRPGFVYDNQTLASSVRPWLYLNEGVSVMIFEPNTGNNWRNPGQQYESMDPIENSCFSYNTTEQNNRINLYTLLNEVIPEGYYVFLFTVQKYDDSDFQPENWAFDSIAIGGNIYSLLEAEGASLVRNLESLGALPYAIMYQKGGGVLDEKITLNITQDVIVNCKIPAQNTAGKMESLKIGPATHWHNFSWQKKVNQFSENDTLKLRLIVEKADGTLETLATDVGEYLDLTQIDAQEYPYLHLYFEAKDENDRTLTPVHFWQVLYNEAPELSLDPNLTGFYFHKDTLSQGEELVFSVPVTNLSSTVADSFSVVSQLFDANNNEIENTQQSIVSLEQGEVELLTYRLNTKDLTGKHRLFMSVNPERNPPEYQYFNNLLLQPFDVIGDLLNPTLEVLFDGEYIQDGQLVSPEPEIYISVLDENPYLLLDDTALVELKLTDPSGKTVMIPLNSTEVQYFLPTEANSNKLEIRYTPKLELDGIYRLSVHATDATGNRSGAFDYEINFEVLTKNSISNVLNYPNPFSNSTQFVYTLTGQPPVYFKIQIMTISGEIVREITQDEVGPLEVGTHAMDYYWNGTDQFGDRLANGVYLYRVIAKDQDGKDFESYGAYTGDNRLGRYFKNGIGKLVILR
jgi:hypothetical protein